MVQHDAVIVGGGPAGLAAAGWLGRYRRSTLLIDADEGRNRWADHLHGVPGNDMAAPEELRAAAREEVQRYPDVTLRAARVRAVRRDDDGMFTVELDGEEVRTRRLVLATGVRDVFPDVEGFFTHYGCDAHHCPTCDGYEARDRTVAVIGWQRHVAGFAVNLLDWATEVRIVTDGRALECEDEVREALDAHGVEVIEDTVTEMVGPRGALEGLRLAGGGLVRARMAFFSIDHQPVTDLAEQLGCALDDDGYVTVDEECCTTVPGVYAAGDLTPGLQLIPVAVGAGTIAGVACAISLQGEPPLDGHAAPAPDPEAVLGQG
jgi:thioredoxin reductase